ncbi:MAG TPA: gephyrin-like molybdotransferase Glp [Verrucomicrobiae bacterium]|nr:gephyrin-like molybdotransferase Glp [Verrucomicrobiae bacterium]
MLELEEAVGRILSRVPPAEPESVPLAQAHGRVLLEAVRASIDLPPFDNSAMDGYAVRSEDTANAQPDKPALLRLTGRVAAGEAFSQEVSEGCCVRIFTGSALPAGADCVVMQEDTRVAPGNPSEILVLEKATPWENVRLRGEDVRAGTAVGLGGKVLNAGTLSVLAAVGVREVKVGRQPAVGLLATGSELREQGKGLREGQIYESNRVGLSALIRCAGGRPVVLPIVADLLESTTQALTEALARCDMVVTVGGASVGDLDLVKPALERVGARLDFWKVAIRPGRPFVFGQAGEKLLFGLPGNPVSALVTFLLLVRPALRRWQGAEATGLPGSHGILAEPLVNTGSRRHFVRVQMSGDGRVSRAGAQASHVLSSFAAAGGLVDVPADATLPAGTPVKVLFWEV